MGPPNLNEKDLTVASLVNHDTMTWNSTKINKILPLYETTIKCFRLSKHGAQDCHIWLPTKSGICTAKTGYHVARALQNLPEEHNQAQVNWMADIWNGRFSPKLKVFLWKIIQKAIPIGENLLHKGLLENFLANPLQLKSIAVPPPTGICSGPIFPWVCWAIWTARNHLLFEDRGFSPDEAILKALLAAKEWQQAQQLETPNPRNGSHQTRVMHADTITCHTDGAWNPETKIAGAGWIFHNQADDRLDSGQGAEPFANSAIMAEAIAIRSALLQAIDKDYLKICIKSDAQDLVRALTSQEQVKEIYGLLFDIKTLASFFTAISFVFIPRSANFEADALAKLASRDLAPRLNKPGLTGLTAAVAVAGVCGCGSLRKREFAIKSCLYDWYSNS
ncbi:unnamed protein product [Microthlaspi erraticum]|uniref:Uncharacterized protein n=1 Tax=Microthlaspi erraticum TaxID=1685480 RepID=A0A6D2KL27_9BRAS|nr:unnamed protein product [Microthlaspi erraticum]